MLVILGFLVFSVGGGVQAGEIIYADDIRENVITKEVLVRTADNVIVLVDTSSSLNGKLCIPCRNLTRPGWRLR